MARTKTPTAAVQPSKGKKITFGDDDDLEMESPEPEAGPSRRTTRREPSSEPESDDDDDDAPEAVGVSKSAMEGDAIASAAEVLAEQSRARKEAARIRNQRINEAKAAKSAAVDVNGKGKGKGKGKGAEGNKRKVQPESEEDDEDDDEETRRLKKRMAAAMAQGDSEDSEMELSGSEVGEEDEDEEEGDDDLEFGDEDEDEETGSFHTDSEEEEEDEEEELDDADSEQLEDEGPIDEKTRQLRARMQAMMEAAESRAKGDAPPTKKSALKKTISSKPNATKEAATNDEEDSDAGYDLAPLSSFGKPLSAEVLRKAEENEKARLAQKAEKAALAKSQKTQGKRTRKKRKVEPTTRVISENKALHVLPPVLSTLSSNGLPPILEPGMRVGSASKVHKNFYKGAMGNSGVKPGMGVMDGRKKRPAR